MQLVDVLPLRILRIEEASSVDMESNNKRSIDCQQVRTPFLSFYMRHLCQNMLSNLSSLLRDMFPTCLISPRNVVEKTFASLFVFVQ